MLALDPGYKANDWFIFIRKGRSSEEFAEEDADLQSDTD